jgi:hypothetical protein
MAACFAGGYRTMHKILFAVAALFLLTGFGPFFVLPGGELAGKAEPAPGDWTFTDAIKTIQFETNPADPYSVNLWVINMNGALYVHAGANRATWVEHLEVEPRCRMRINQTIYAFTASRVTEASVFGQFSDAYEKKYDRRPRNENVNEAYLYRLSPQ